MKCLEHLRQILFDTRVGNSNLAKSLCVKSNHGMYMYQDKIDTETY